jgi:metal-responsive CopG/Arc/MetJ family transcriptional regulator
MSFLYQIERKQAALIAARERGDELKVARKPIVAKEAATPSAAPAAVTIGVQIELPLSAQIDALVMRHIVPSKKAAILAALHEYLTRFEFDAAVAQAARVPTEEVRRITIGVELDAALNARLNAFCKRFNCYKRRAAVAALTYYVETHGKESR